MSQSNRKYKRLEALLSESKPVDPNPVSQTANDEVEALKAKVSILEAALQENRKKSQSNAASFDSIHKDNFSPSDIPQNLSSKKHEETIKASSIQGFFSAPIFEDDREKTRSAKLLHQITMASWVLPLLATAVAILNPTMVRFVLPAGVLLAVVLTITMYLNRIGKTRLASNIIVGFVFIVFTYLNYAGAGEPRPLQLLVVIAIMMSGLLLGDRGPLIVSILLVIQHTIITSLSAKGFIFPQSTPPGPFQNIIVTTVSYLLIGFMLRLAISRVQIGLIQIRENEKELQIRNRELQNLSSSLELRVQDRTNDLELASEVGRTIAEKVENISAMLTEATEMIRSRFNLYYTQVYLLDPSGQMITLRAGTGNAGKQLLQRGHHLLVSSSSLNGRAVSEKKAVIVADTEKSNTFLPNPLLPNTRSEMAIPLLVGDRVLGVLDMQSEIPDALNEDNIAAFQVLAGQLSVAIQNATLFKQSEEARKQVEANVRRTTEIGWQDFMDGTDRGEKIGYVFDQTEVKPLERDSKTQSENVLSTPITVTGATVGSIQVAQDEREWTSNEAEIIQSTAEQLAQHIENLRLLSQAEKYRQEAEQTSRRLTREGWEGYLQTRNALAAGYSFNPNEVKTEYEEAAFDSSSTLSLPITVREEAIGELMINTANVETDAVSEIFSAVAEQLGDHIENLRLSEENEMRAVELEKLVTQLRELDRLKSSFLANMSHELRTPLNSILGFSDVMLEGLDGPLTDNMNNDLNLIQKNGQHLLHLINDVLDMAKIDSGKMNLNVEKFNVHDLLTDVTSITSSLAKEKSLELIIEPDSDNEVEINADKIRLRQVMINLVNNAMKFTDQGSISLRARCENNNVLISVKDTGIGIPLNHLESVFQEFTQVDTTTTRKAGGTGLGLPISRRLINMHSGRLWAESTGINGEGSTFYVTLPIEANINENATLTAN